MIKNYDKYLIKILTIAILLTERLIMNNLRQVNDIHRASVIRYKYPGTIF